VKYGTPKTFLQYLCPCLKLWSLSRLPAIQCLHEARNPTEIMQQKHSTAITHLPFYTAFSLFSFVINFIPHCRHPDNAPICRSHTEFSKPHSANQRIHPQGSQTLLHVQRHPPDGTMLSRGYPVKGPRASLKGEHG
jgi:hypothetical protein